MNVFKHKLDIVEGTISEPKNKSPRKTEMGNVGQVERQGGESDKLYQSNRERKEGRGMRDNRSKDENFPKPRRNTSPQEQED